MRKFTLGAVLALAAVSAAAAADFSRSYAPVSAFSWAGPYVGLNLGYQWSTVSNSGADPSGFAGGLQGGINWQNGQFVYGAETDLQLSGADDTSGFARFSNPWFGTLRGRAGWAMNNILFYGTLGLAYGGSRVEVGGLSESHSQFGWAAGAGMEVGLSNNWSAKFEYLFVDLSSEHYALTAFDHRFEESLLRFGFNYRF